MVLHNPTSDYLTYHQCYQSTTADNRLSLIQMDLQPAGVFVLETAQVQMDLFGGQFAFSITFRDDLDKKHIFAARTESDVHIWVNSLKKAT